MNGTECFAMKNYSTGIAGRVFHRKKQVLSMVFLMETGFVPEVHSIQDICLGANAFLERIRFGMVGFIVRSFQSAGVFSEICRDGQHAGYIVDSGHRYCTGDSCRIVLLCEKTERQPCPVVRVHVWVGTGWPLA